MESYKIEITVQTMHISELSAEQRQWFDLAKEAACGAYAPYSHFRVGAAVALRNGVVMTGSNQENAAYPSGMCAERVALFSAGAQYPDVTIRALTVFAFTNDPPENIISPCGACRQVLFQSECRQLSPIEVMLCSQTGVRILSSAECLLPLPFS
jgi:cytidine deaminase